jgi:hypothetical protein
MSAARRRLVAGDQPLGFIDEIATNAARRTGGSAAESVFRSADSEGTPEWAATLDIGAYAVWLAAAHATADELQEAIRGLQVSAYQLLLKMCNV